MKICILNFADGAFLKGQERLRASLRKIGFPEGDMMFWSALPAGWPAHADVPWGFKVYAFEEARRKGYDMAVWIDAAGIAYRPLDPILEIMRKDGAFLFSRFNASVGEWSSDLALQALGVSREKAFHIPELSAFCIGIDFGHEKGREFLGQWKKYADDGISFLGVAKPYGLKDSMSNAGGILSEDPRVKGHRHDQTVASVVASRLGIRPTSRFVFDLVGEAKSGHPYASYIPLDTVIVQDRDIKGETYLRDLSDLSMSFVALKSAWRYAKDRIKWVLVYRRRYRQSSVL